MSSGARIRLPISATRRSQQSYIKLLARIDPRSRSPFEWRGRFFLPGTWIHEGDMWPEPGYPRAPLLIEYLGALKPAKGWNRHKSDNTAILWRYERAPQAFRQVGRVDAPGGLWMRLLEPLVMELMSVDATGLPAVDVGVVRDRVARVINAELDVLTDAQRLRALTMIHDEIATRIALVVAANSADLTITRLN